MDPSGHKYVWNKTVWVKGPPNYFYRKGYIKGKKGSIRNRKLRVGSNKKNKYVIEYYKLKKTRKKECDKYVDYINNCNDHYDQLVIYVSRAALNMSAYALLQRMDCAELAEEYQEDGNEELFNVGMELSNYLDDLDVVKSTFKKIKKYGKKFS